MRIILLIPLFLLCACQWSMTDEEVIKAVQECRKHPGFTAQVYQNGFTFEVLRVVCLPSEVKK